MEEQEKNLTSDGQEKKKEKANWNIRPYLAVALLTFIVFCLCIAVFFIILRFNGVKAGWDKLMKVLQPIIIGGVIAYLINPVMKFIERHLDKPMQAKIKSEKGRKKFCRTVGTFGALAFFLLIIFLLIEMIVPQLIQSISGVVTDLPNQVNGFIKWTDNIAKNNNQWAAVLEEAVRKGSDFLQNWFKNSFLPDINTYITEITSGVINVAKVLINALVGLIIAVYLLLSKEKFVGQAKKIIYALIPAKQANVVIHTIRKSNEIFGGFISGKILDSAIIGVLCYIVLVIMRMPYTLLVSVIVGCTNVIPFFGPFIGAVPSFIIIALADPIKGIYFVIFVVILQQIDGNIIGPKILGDSTGLSSFWVVFAILVGGGLFGFAGMLLGVPTFAVIYYILSHVFSFILKKRKLPPETEAYIYATHVDSATGDVVYNRKYQAYLDAKKKTEDKKES